MDVENRDGMVGCCLFFSFFLRSLVVVPLLYYGASSRCGTDRRAGLSGKSKTLNAGKCAPKYANNSENPKQQQQTDKKKRKRNKSLWMNSSSICSRPFRPAVRSHMGEKINTATTQLYDMCVAATKFGFFLSFFLSFFFTNGTFCVLFVLNKSLCTFFFFFFFFVEAFISFSCAITALEFRMRIPPLVVVLCHLRRVLLVVWIFSPPLFFYPHPHF